jgi:hypothetical protein
MLEADIPSPEGAEDEERRARQEPRRGGAIRGTVAMMIGLEQSERRVKQVNCRSRRERAELAQDAVLGSVPPELAQHG